MGVFVLFNVSRQAGPSTGFPVNFLVQLVSIALLRLLDFSGAGWIQGRLVIRCDAILTPRVSKLKVCVPSLPSSVR